MKLYIFLLLSLFIFVSAQAQKTKQKPFVPDKYGYVKDPKFHKLIKERGYQLVSKFDTIKRKPLIIAAQVLDKGNWKSMDINGKLIEEEIPPKAWEVEPNIGLVEIGRGGTPDDYLDIYNRKDSFIKFYENNYQGTRNKKNGNIGLPPTYKFIQFLGNGFVSFNENGKHGIAFSYGKIIAPAAYEKVWPITGHLQVIIKKDGKYGTLDSSGNAIIPLEYEEIIHCDRCSKSKNLLLVKKNNNWGMLTLDGKEVISIENRHIGELFPGLILVGKGYPPKVGLADSTGKYILEIGQDKITYNSGFIVFKKGWLMGIMKLDGNILLHQLYTDIYPINNELFKVEKDYKFGVINNNEKFIIEPVYSHINVMADRNLVEVANDERKWGYLNLQGDTVVQLIYDGIVVLKNNKFLFLKDGKHGIIDANGKVLNTFDYNTVKPAADFLVIVKGELQGIIDFEGNVLVPIKYNSFFGAESLYYDGICTAYIGGRSLMVDRYGNECFGACGR